MKKIFLLTALAALLMASCSLDETKEINMGRGIGFRISFDKTRATEVTTANLGEFWVTSFSSDVNATGNFFENAKFTKAGEHFESDPPYYWPEGELSFYAYSPSKDNLGGELKISKDGQTLEGYSPKAAIGEQKDFIFAKAKGSKTANEGNGVALTFNHALSQIEIQAKCDAEAGWEIKVKGVKICEPVGKGTFSFGTVGTDDDAWEIPETPEKTTYEVSHTSDVNVGTTATSLMVTADGNAMLIPQQLTAWDTTVDGNDKKNLKKGAYLAVNIHATVKGSDTQFFPYAVAGGDTPEYGWVAVPIGTNWEAGKRYTYILDFTNGLGVYPPGDPEHPGDPVAKNPISFTVNVEEWDKASIIDFIDKGIHDIKMVYVEGGTFWMGSQKTDESQPNYNSNANANEQPVHKVTLDSYYIGKYEVTQGLWKKVMGEDKDIHHYAGSKPLRGEGDDYPMYYVSYNDIVNDFLPKLNEITKKNYTLPTEAQWEFAAAGGKAGYDEDGKRKHLYSGSDILNDVAWWGYMGSGTATEESSYPVGTKQRNELDIYDMSGNIFELCLDHYDANYYQTCSTQDPVSNPQGPETGSGHVYRGGGWTKSANNCRVSYRTSFQSSTAFDYLGFRLALSYP